MIAGLKKFLSRKNILLPFLFKIQGLVYSFFSKNSHQISNFTIYNRYPLLFSYAKNYFEDFHHSDPKILCYGCSTGEECFSLNTYFTEAEITGLDIQKKAVAKARKKNNSKNITFLLSTTQNLFKNGPYDIIFAMAVFCRWPASNYYKDISKLYPFIRFERKMHELSQVLKPGGLLFMNNTNFYFQDTDLFSNYELLETPDGVEEDVVPKFSKDNEWLGTNDHNGVIFRKVR